MPTQIHERGKAADLEPSGGVAAVWLVFYLLMGVAALISPAMSGITDIAMLVSP